MIGSMATFGEQVRALMDRRGLDRKALAQRIGVGIGQVDKWRLDDANPTFDNVCRIALALDVSLDALAAGVADTATPSAAARVATLFQQLRHEDRLAVWGILHSLHRLPAPPLPADGPDTASAPAAHP